MDTGAWPRTMAVGERGWRAKETRDTDDALTRFHEWRCKSESARRSVYAPSIAVGQMLRLGCAALTVCALPTVITRGINAEPLEPGTHCPKEFVPSYATPW